MARQNFFFFFWPAPKKVCPTLSYTMGTGPFPGLKRPERALTTHSI